MPELRKDPIAGRWTIMAKNRARRPGAFESASTAPAPQDCPFCEGHESLTPGEVLAFRAGENGANGPGWRVRVVPNKYPAVMLAAEPAESTKIFQECQQAVGAHEVVIESPDHVISTTGLGAEHLQEVLWAYRERLDYWHGQSVGAYGMFFKNFGPAAGASIEHAHSQLIVLPIAPDSVRQEMSHSRSFYEREKRCIFCALVERELAAGRRIVADSPDFVALCPFAARFPYETWLLPKAHAGHYQRLSYQSAGGLARVMHEVLRKIEKALDQPAYNYVLHTSPFDTDEQEHYHWHIEITPRLTKIAGFELATGIYINPVPPEQAAERLRRALS